VGEDGHESVLSTGGGDSEFGVSIKGCCGGEEMVIDVGGGSLRVGDIRYHEWWFTSLGYYYPIKAPQYGEKGLIRCPHPRLPSL